MVSTSGKGADCFAVVVRNSGTGLFPFSFPEMGALSDFKILS